MAKNPAAARIVHIEAAKEEKLLAGDFPDRLNWADLIDLSACVWPFGKCRSSGRGPKLVMCMSKWLKAKSGFDFSPTVLLKLQGTCGMPKSFCLKQFA